jgi:MFS family permease
MCPSSSEPAAASASAGAALLRRLDETRWNRFHTVVTMVLGVGWLLDSFEVTVINNVVSVFKEIWHLTNFDASWILSIWFIGLMMGALFFGYLADRFGRRRLFLLTLLLYGVFTFLTAFAWNYTSMLVFRFLTAIGVGAEYSAINAAISEFIPGAHRGKANAAVMNFWSLGAILAALVSLFLINSLPPDVGWRAAFGFGAIVALGTAVMRRYIPESPRWLLARGETAAAENVVGEIERGHWHARRTPHIAVRGTRPMRSFLSQTMELIRRHPGRVALGCALDFSEAAGYYGLFAFLPLFILPQLHVSAQFVPWFYLVGNVGALIGGFVVVFLLDRAGRKLTVPVFYLLAAGGVLVLAAATVTHDWRWVLAAFTLANLLATGAWISAYPTFSEIFPTDMRSTGIGLAIAIGRIGAFGAPLALTAVATFVGMIPALALLAGFWLIGAAAMIPWYFFGVEGRGRTLEQMITPQVTR